MKYRIVESKDGFRVEKYIFPPPEKKQTWLTKIYDWIIDKPTYGWELLARDGEIYRLIDFTGFGDYEEISPKAVFKTEDKAKRFLNRITMDEKVVCEVS